jgi:Lon protease-like protein
MDEIKISLFPIPGSVSLPFSVVPLHIFEPRYRQMITDSVNQKRRIGVAHTKRVIAQSQLDSDASTEEILNTNQDTYEAWPVFSAGFAKILETLPDGRMIVEIQMDYRYEIIDEVQQLPYKIVRCRPYEDTGEDDILATRESQALRLKLDEQLLALQGPSLDQLKKHVQSPALKGLSTLEYSFAIYSLVQFEPDVMQQVLELASASDRIGFLLELL